MVNTVTTTEVVREQSRAFQCIGDTIPNREKPESYEKLNFLIKFVKDKQFNTEKRKNARNTFLEDVRSYSDLNQICDIDYSKLPN